MTTPGVLSRPCLGAAFGLLACLGLATSLPAQGCTVAATYLTITDGDTVAVESVTHRGALTLGSILAAGGPGIRSLLRYEAEFAEPGLFRSLRLAVWPSAADSAGAPTQEVRVTFDSATVLARVFDARRGVQSQSYPVPRGVMPYMDNIPLFITALVNRATRLQADSVDIPTLWLFTRNHQEVATVLRRGRDSLTIRTPQMTFDVATDGDGLLRSHRGDGVMMYRAVCGTLIDSHH